jgi:hypothetical protein
MLDNSKWILLQVIKLEMLILLNYK